MFKLPEEIIGGIQGYKNSLQDFLANKMSAARFAGVRVPWGFYSHRGGRVFMGRIRIPAGLITASQLRAIAEVARQYGNGILHITTRQDIQIHGVKIEDTIKVMEYLKDYELSPRGGGGNTVRNVTSCPLAGICKDEILDTRAYAVSLSEYLLRQDNSYILPRKFKIAFSGCAKDCAGCLFNDVGLLATRFEGKNGFQVFVGGGMGLVSVLGNLLEEFIPEEDLGYCVEAIKRVFYKRGDRKNKHHNRLRFLIKDIGFEEFKVWYQKEFKELKEKEYIALRKINFPQPQEEHGHLAQKEEEEYRDFLRYNVQAQKQNGFSIVEVRISCGDIGANELLKVAQLEEGFKGIEFRTSQNQNLLICWVRNQDLYNLYLKLKATLNGFLYPQTLLDVVTCKGALTCNLGLCNSQGLAKALEEVVKEEFIGKKAFKALEIKLNGCPNACGQAPLGKIAFYGLSRRVDNRPVPFYKLMLGGKKAGKKSRLASEIGIIPARNVPDFLKAFLKRIEPLILEEEEVYTVLEKEATRIAKETLEEFSFVPGYSQDRTFYVDWGKTEDFSLAGLGGGECGAGVIDMIEADLAMARISLEEAEKEDFSVEKIKRVLFLTARALLVVRGKDPRSEKEALTDFIERFINEGYASSSYLNIQEVFAGLSGDLDRQTRRERFLYAREFFAHVSQIYKNMDPQFNFLVLEEKPKIAEKTKMHLLDLKGTPCPINYVKAKLFLENLEPQEPVEILLDEGEPIMNVPKSLEADGHIIIKIEREDGFYRVIVKKADK